MARNNRRNGQNHTPAGLVAVDLGETAPGSDVREFALIDQAGREMGTELLDATPGLRPLLGEGTNICDLTAGEDRVAGGLTARLMRDVGGLPAIAPTLALFFGGTGREVALALIAHLRSIHRDSASYDLVRCFLKILVVDSSDENSEFMGETIADGEFLHVYANLEQVLEEVRLTDDHPAFAYLEREDLLRIPPGEVDGNGSGKCRPRGFLDLLSNIRAFEDAVDSQLQDISRAIQEARTELGGTLPAAYRTLDVLLSASSAGGAGSAMLPLATSQVELLCRRRGLSPRVQLNVVLPSVFEDFDAYQDGLSLTYPTLSELNRL